MLILAGTSGVGKTTVRNELLKKEIYGSCISITTRKPRQGEVDGIDYYFTTREEFENRIENGKIIEWAEYNGELYGTPSFEIRRVVEMGKLPVLILEPQGVQFILENFGDMCYVILLVPPSLEEVERRLLKRDGEIKRVCEDMSHIHYHVSIVNNDIHQCVDTIHMLVECWLSSSI